MKIKTQQNLCYTLKPVLREKFLDSFKPSKLNQEEINQHPKQTCNKWGDWSDNKSLSTRKIPGPDGFTTGYCQTSIYLQYPF